MERPPSIARFEQLYALALVLSLLGWWLSWGSMRHQLAANPAAAGMAGWALPVVVVLWALVWALLLWLVAARASVAAKWIVVVLAGAGVVRLLVTLPALLGGMIAAPVALQAIATTVLTVAAAAMLFRDDARLWFGEGLGEPDATDPAEPLA